MWKRNYTCVFQSPRQNWDFWVKVKRKSVQVIISKVFSSPRCCYTMGPAACETFLRKWIIGDERREDIKRLPVLGGGWAEGGSSPRAPPRLGVCSRHCRGCYGNEEENHLVGVLWSPPDNQSSSISLFIEWDPPCGLSWVGGRDGGMKHVPLMLEKNVNP